MVRHCCLFELFLCRITCTDYIRLIHLFTLFHSVLCLFSVLHHVLICPLSTYFSPKSFWSLLSFRLVIVYREEPTPLSRLLSHGSAGLPEEPVHPAVADGLCVRGERPHHKLHPALHMHSLADQQTTLPQNQLPALLFPLEP